MARCLLLGITDNAGNLPVVDGGTYTGGSQVCLTVALDPSEYQTWTTTSALVTGFDIPAAVTIVTAAAALWAFAWVLSMVRR